MALFFVAGRRTWGKITWRRNLPLLEVSPPSYFPPSYDDKNPPSLSPSYGGRRKNPRTVDGGTRGILLQLY
jgi:hypothetical protein